MIVTITVKCRPDSPADETFNESFKDFRKMLELAEQSGGFGRPVTLRWVIQRADGLEVNIV